MDDLFSLGDDQVQAEAPLAARMRPRTLAEFAGQEHIVGPGTVLRAAIEGGQLFSMLFFGPPGCGKTTLARLIAAETGARLVQLSAVNSGTADVRAAIKARRRGAHADAARARCSSSTRSTASTRRSRTRCCRRSRTAWSR